jgi:spore coat protein U-like protein
MKSVRAIMTTIMATAIVAALGPRVLAGSCEVSASPVVFGSYEPTHPSDLVTVGTLILRCSGVRGPVKIELTAGDSNNFHQRIMRQGNSKLAYNLYVDPTATSVWGDGSAGSQVFTTPAPTFGALVRVPVYGRIQSRQDASAGNYSDNVSVVLSF